jgi:hypothetical protein
MFSAKISSSPDENLTPAHRMGDDGIFNIVFSLEASSIIHVKFLNRQEMC